MQVFKNKVKVWLINILKASIKPGLKQGLLELNQNDPLDPKS